MPHRNAFRHQTYHSNPPEVSFRSLRPATQPAVDSEEFCKRMAAMGRRLADCKVRRIILVHGTLAGTDATGLLGELGRVVPGLASMLREQGKRIVDMIAHDWGNYDEEFVRVLHRGLNAEIDKEIEVRRFFWSSENHGIGRADAAVNLFSRLVRRKGEAGDRVLLWGHSHAGNVFALLTNLLGSTVDERKRFFSVARPYYRVPTTGKVDVPVWEVARQRLMEPGNPLGDTHLDLVTFGTPIRYGWETSGYSKLLHFVQHVVDEDLAEYLVAFPPKLEQIVSGAAGDFFQQLFIAGTNFPPNLIALRSWTAERRLNRLIQTGLRRRGLWERLKAGMRVPNEGETLLVDYFAADAELAKQMSGHAVYTRQEFLPFHLEEMVKQMYPESVEVSYE